MRIAHLADTHLGAVGQDIQPSVDDPFAPGVRVTQRTADILCAFERTVDLVLAQQGVDLVIHAGDLFDSSRPSLAIVDVAMRQMRRLTDAGIPLVIVEGNHSYPRDKAMGHALRLLEFLPRTHVVCDEYADVRIDGLDVVVHALAHGPLFEGRAPKDDCLDPSCANVLVAHGVVDENRRYYDTDRAGAAIHLRPCSEWYDAIALGHCHRFCQPGLYARAFYAGAPTMVTWRDFQAGGEFGFNLLDVGAELTVTRVPVPGRAMRAYGLDDASGVPAPEIVAYLERQAAAAAPGGAYCWVQVRNIDPQARKELMLRRRYLELEVFGSAAGLRLQLEPGRLPWAETLRAQREGGTPLERFEQMVKASDGDPEFKRAVGALGSGFLERAADGLAGQADA